MSPPQLGAIGRQAVDFAMAVGVRVGDCGGHQRCLAKVVEAGHWPVSPCPVVLPDVVRRRPVDHEYVEVAVAVEVGEQCLAAVAVADDSHLGGQAAEGAVPVVAVQFVAFRADGEHIEVAIVIRVGNGPRQAGFVAEGSVQRPLASRCLPPVVDAAGPAEDRIDDAVVVDIAPQRCHDRRGGGERTARHC